MRNEFKFLSGPIKSKLSLVPNQKREVYEKVTVRKWVYFFPSWLLEIGKSLKIFLQILQLKFDDPCR